MNLKDKLNHYGSIKEPFLFIIDFEMKNFEVIVLKDLPNDIKYNINNDKTTIQRRRDINDAWDYWKSDDHCHTSR